jgi:hypothetical protein
MQNTSFKFHRSNITIDLIRLMNWWIDYSIKETPRYNQPDDEYQTHETFGEGAYGWQLHEPNLTGAIPIEEEGTSVDSPLMSKRASFKFTDEVRKVRNQDYTIRSKNFTGYLADILDHFPEAYRCGMKVFRPGFRYKLHVDPPRERHYRIHIPIITNSECRHEVLGEVMHFPVDHHLWFMNTGVEHRAWNHGTGIRVHVYWQMPIETFDKYKNMEIRL